MRRLFSAYMDLKEASAEKSEKYAYATVQKFAFDFDRGHVEGTDFPEYKDLMRFSEIESLLGISAKPEPQLLRQRELLFFKAIFRHIQTKVDPTGGKYTLWIIKRYGSGLLGSWEDMGRVKEALTSYRLLHNKRWWNKSVEAKEATASLMSEINGIGGTRFSAMHVDAYRNIDHINSLNSLQVLELLVKASGIQDFEVEGAYEKHKGKGFNVIYEGEEGYVIQLKTVEASVDLFRGPTAWCTARPDNPHFDAYLDNGPLYALYDKKQKYYLQAHNNTSDYKTGEDEKDWDYRKMTFLFQYQKPFQIMDARDNPVDWEDFSKLALPLREALMKKFWLPEPVFMCAMDAHAYIDWAKTAPLDELAAVMNHPLVVAVEDPLDTPRTSKDIYYERRGDPPE